MLNRRKKTSVLLKFLINSFNKDFFRWFLPVIGSMSIFFGLLLFLSSYRLAEASVNNSGCDNVSVSIVNNSGDLLNLFSGADSNIQISPYSSGEYNINLGKYYTKCGRFDIEVINGVKKMLVSNGVSNVSVRYNSINDIETSGISHDDLDLYVDWNGFKEI